MSIYNSGESPVNVTRKDIAREAGVSVSVVSRALNNSGYVEKGKKQRIIQIASTCGYIPNPVAMALQQRKTYQLLFLCGDLTGAYFNQMYHGMVREAQKRGYSIQAAMNFPDFEKVKRIPVDGILFPSEGIAQAYVESVGRTYFLPTVTASFDSSVAYVKPMPSVIIDNYKVINNIIDYLKKRKHRKLGILLPFNGSYANVRFEYWKERMLAELGDEYKKYIIDMKGEAEHPKERAYSDLRDYYCESAGFGYCDLVAAGRSAAGKFAASKCKSTAIVCFNDDLAIGFIQGLKKYGIRVPEDLSVMGIDGIYTREHFEPLLTTMSLYPDRQGAMSAGILIDLLEGKKYKYMNYSPYGILEGETVRDL